MILNLLLEVKGEHPDLAKKFNGRVHKNRTMLPLVSKDNLFDLKEYPVGKIVFESWEYGGGTDSGMGMAHIVCGIDGNPLKPVFIRKKGHLKNNKHAYFNIPAKNGLAIIKAIGFSNQYTLHIYRALGIKFVGDSVFELSMESMTYSFENKEDIELLTEKNLFIIRYKNAIDKAIEKLETINCKKAMYYI